MQWDPGCLKNGYCYLADEVISSGELLPKAVELSNGY